MNANGVPCAGCREFRLDARRDLLRLRPRALPIGLLHGVCRQHVRSGGYQHGLHALSWCHFAGGELGPVPMRLQAGVLPRIDVEPELHAVPVQHVLPWYATPHPHGHAFRHPSASLMK